MTLLGVVMWVLVFATTASPLVEPTLSPLSKPRSPSEGSSLAPASLAQGDLGPLPVAPATQVPVDRWAYLLLQGLIPRRPFSTRSRCLILRAKGH